MGSAQVDGSPCGLGDTTVNGALGNTLELVQPARGYRFSLDAILLARFAAEQPADRVLDLGCGCGVVGLSLLALKAVGTLVGIDVQEQMIACARASVERNGRHGAASFRRLDLRSIRGNLEPESFDLVVSNPPFRAVGSGRMSSTEVECIARHEVSCCVADTAEAARYALKLGGNFCLVYPAQRLPTVLAACTERGLQPRVMRFVHPRREQAARLVLVRCVKRSGEDLVVQSPLILHTKGGAYSAEALTLLGPP